MLCHVVLSLPRRTQSSADAMSSCVAFKRLVARDGVPGSGQEAGLGDALLVMELPIGPRSDDRVAGVDQQKVTVDEVRARSRKEHRGIRHVFWLWQGARRQSLELGLYVLEVVERLLGPFRGNQRRSNRIDVDSMSRPLACEPACQLEGSSLTCAIGRPVRFHHD